MDNTGFENLLRRVYSSRGLTLLFRAVNAVASCFTVLTFLLLIYGAASVSMLRLLRLLVVLGIPYAAVTILRKAVNAKRPYEIYDFYKNQPKNCSGLSFPSRHAASVMIIATVALFLYGWVGALLSLLGVLMCISRVMLGIHFPRDVIAGGCIGVASALIGTLILLI